MTDWQEAYNQHMDTCEVCSDQDTFDYCDIGQDIMNHLMKEALEDE